MIKALDYAEAGAVQPYNYTLLVWATVLGVVVFGDFPDGWTILGAAIVVASGLYTWHHDRQVAATRSCRSHVAVHALPSAVREVSERSRGFRQRALWPFEIAPPIGWAAFGVRTVTLVALSESPVSESRSREPVRRQAAGRAARCLAAAFWSRINDA